MGIVGFVVEHANGIECNIGRRVHIDTGTNGIPLTTLNGHVLKGDGSREDFKDTFVLIRINDRVADASADDLHAVANIKVTGDIVCPGRERVGACAHFDGPIRRGVIVDREDGFPQRDESVRTTVGQQRCDIRSRAVDGIGCCVDGKEQRTGCQLISTNIRGSITCRPELIARLRRSDSSVVGNAGRGEGMDVGAVGLRQRCKCRIAAQDVRSNGAGEIGVVFDDVVTATDNRAVDISSPVL
ncbi:hypothetical protein Pla22_29010 [Rubripirellula amarantea]|uniref:Uncharacterized protein n=1 Tax=Rubripirellula amarantea TaxID=2527999 RepID=A0A5C5WJG0_9BACT|nr:hypothetical protein Pla22_29010 [Rubripirellula amarantea]